MNWLQYQEALRKANGNHCKFNHGMQQDKIRAVGKIAFLYAVLKLA